ncbi:large-conductance mechanosensitive channel protein MscL [Mycolicibacterium gilvum]|uniref:Large-conductance mechanosensitive channel n=2 Tax=Mycolicibacterium gilvum TaxID=1804 RepID=E6TI25_MYCSR|nr:large-conductance mechanosensitive channel protein MscL [Mycolicibacterium gilvum]ABP44372.1 large conductance mechanosensitive channel protein [Mycolicibacterium gilvum PYR-GCK]ADT97972.1 large conductance mechanosensitive channel protein [Mycolicibacterium gilvum Spyr1]
MLKGFKEFISRGNVIDLAVAVVVGAAFTGLVTAFTQNVVQPLVDRIGAGPDAEYGILKIPLGADQFVDLNAVLSAAINFLIVAAVIYFVIVVPFKKIKERDAKVVSTETELTLLTEIRDLLQAQSSGTAATATDRDHTEQEQPPAGK